MWLPPGVAGSLATPLDARESAVPQHARGDGHKNEQYGQGGHLHGRHDWREDTHRPIAARGHELSRQRVEQCAKTEQNICDFLFDLFYSA